MLLDRNLTLNYNMCRAKRAKVWFPAGTALRRGVGLCYDPFKVGTGTGETATDRWGRRGNDVFVPSPTFNRYFAGVTMQSYAASAGGTLVDIALPGSVVEIATGLATAIGTSPADGTMLTCSASSADAGRFTLKGLPGQGSAIALQTVARADGGDIAFASFDGTMTTAWTTVTTITKTGIGTACGNGDATIDPTEFVIAVVAGATTANGTIPVTVGEYAVLTAPTADTITIAENIMTDSAAAAIVGYVIKNSYPTVLAYLMDGEESGLQEVLSMDSATAVASMTGGATFVAGGITLAVDSTFTLPDDTSEGLKKVFAGLGALTTGNYQITVTSGVEADNTALAGITVDAADEHITLEWRGSYGGGSGGHWRELSSAGVTKS